MDRFTDELQARRGADETDREFAARLGIDQGNWSRIQQGKRRVGQRVAARAIALWPELEPIYLESVRAQLHGTATASPDKEKAERSA